MKPVIRSLTLKGFRSFESERIELDNPTFFVGRNAAGKSNLVDALSFLQEAMRHPLDEVMQKRGGIGSIVHRSDSQDTHDFGIRIDFEGRGIQKAFYSLQLRVLNEDSFEVANEQCSVSSREGESWFSRGRKSFNSNVEGLQPLLDPHGLALPLVGADKRFRPIYSSLYYITIFKMQIGNLRQPQKAQRHDRLASNWTNAANVLQDLAEKSPPALDRISEILSALTPVPTRVVPRVQGGMVSLEFQHSYPDGRTANFDAWEMSDGTLQILGLLLAIFQRFSGSLMILEEPEGNIHPGALRMVTDLLRSLSERHQVLVTTHSPELLDAKWITDRFIRVVYWDRDTSRVSEVGKASRETLQEGVMGAGELLRSSVLDSPPVHRAETHPPLFEVLP
jgi:predicted ATPase